jgi:hypothetical protein
MKAMALISVLLAHTMPAHAQERRFIPETPVRDLSTQELETIENYWRRRLEPLEIDQLDEEVAFFLDILQQDEFTYRDVDIRQAYPGLLNHALISTCRTISPEGETRSYGFASQRAGVSVSVKSLGCDVIEGGLSCSLNEREGFSVGDRFSLFFIVEEGLSTAEALKVADLYLDGVEGLPTRFSKKGVEEIRAAEDNYRIKIGNQFCECSSYVEVALRGHLRERLQLIGSSMSCR